MKYLAIFVFLIYALSSVAFAADKLCHSNDMNGRWVSYQGAVLGNPHTGICKFKVANGLAQGSCDFSVGFKGQFQGEVIVNTDCSANFVMDFNPGAPVVSDFQVQLHKDKQSFVGRWSNNFGVIGVTNAVKQ